MRILKNIYRWQGRIEQIAKKLLSILADFNIVHSVDISMAKPTQRSDIGYTRLFGKGKHNEYQFTDEELQEID